MEQTNCGSGPNSYCSPGCDEPFALQEHPLDSCSASNVPGSPDLLEIFSLPASLQPGLIFSKCWPLHFSLLNFLRYLSACVSRSLKAVLPFCESTTSDKNSLILLYEIHLHSCHSFLKITHAISYFYSVRCQCSAMCMSPGLKIFPISYCSLIVQIN